RRSERLAVGCEAQREDHLLMSHQNRLLTPCCRVPEADVGIGIDPGSRREVVAARGERQRSNERSRHASLWVSRFGIPEGHLAGADRGGQRLAVGAERQCPDLTLGLDLQWLLLPAGDVPEEHLAGLAVAVVAAS